MGGGNALEVLEHYKNKILRYTNDETVLLHCLNKLDMVNVTIQLLQETMIGKTVGLIKKQYGDGPVGVQAKALVTKWKEVVRVEEEQAQIRANSEEEMNESAPGSPQSAVNQSADNSADNQSADDAESAVVKTEYIPTPLIPTYTPTPINQLETDSSSESARKQHKHKKSSREKDEREKQSRDGQREKEEYRRDKEGERRKEKEDGRKEKEECRRDKDKDHKSSSRGSREEASSSRSSKEEGGSSRSIKEEGKSSSRSHDKDKERERRKHQEREDSKRKDKKESRDEEKGSSRHKREETEEEREKRKKETEEEREKRKKETEEEREKRKKHSHSSKEHSSSRKIKEEPNTRKIKEEPSERSSKEETSSRSSKEHTSSRKIKEEPLFNMEQSASSRKSKEESSSSRNGKHEHSSSSRKIKEEKPSSSSSKSDRQELSCDVLEDRATNNSGSESNCDITTTGEKDKTSDFKHKKDKKDKHRDSKRDKERSHKSNEKRPELMELDMFSQIPTDSNKEKSRKRHRNDGESSDSSEKRRKVENGKPSSSNSSLPAALCMAPSLALAPGGPLATSGLSLPEISPHYKPLPRAPLQSRHQPSEEDRLDELMGKKKGRSEIYSGKKRQRFFGEVPSLFDQCILKLQDHVDDIDEVGDLTFDILKPVLERAAPQTLMHIEDLNQELMTGPTNTSELWEKHCQRDFRNKKREEMESWREMYERCTTERERKLDLLKGKIKKTTVTDKAALRHCKLAYPDVVAKPPRDVAIKQAKHGTGLPTGTVTKVGAVVRPKVSDPTAGNSRPSTVKKHKVPPNLAKVKTMMKGMSRFGRR